MLPENRVATHPGEILKEEFLDPVGITQVAFAQHIGVPLQRVDEIIRGLAGYNTGNSLAFFAGIRDNTSVSDEHAKLL